MSSHLHDGLVAHILDLLRDWACIWESLNVSRFVIRKTWLKR